MFFSQAPAEGDREPGRTGSSYSAANKKVGWGHQTKPRATEKSPHRTEGNQGNTFTKCLKQVLLLLNAYIKCTCTCTFVHMYMYKCPFKINKCFHCRRYKSKILLHMFFFFWFILGQDHKATTGTHRPEKCGRTSVWGPETSGLYRKV